MFNYQHLSNTTVPPNYYSDLGWENKRFVNIDVGTILNHGNRSGIDGGAGQSGLLGEEIWLTSENDYNAAYAYSQGKALLQYEVIIPIKLAVFDEPGNQVFPDEIKSWELAKQDHNLDGVLTEYTNSKEIFLFNRNKIVLKARVEFSSIPGFK